MARKPMTSRSASGEGESRNADMIHCSFGMTTRRARIAAPDSQFTTMRMRSTTYAIGSAADDETRFGMIHSSGISNINKSFIEYRQVIYWYSINNRPGRVNGLALPWVLLLILLI